MELYIDTADIKKIEKYCEVYPLDGFTCNPTIVAGSDATVEELMKLAPNKKVFAQAIATDCEGIIKDAKKLYSVRKDAYIKIPCTSAGYQAMYSLSKDGHNVLATAVYTVGQAIMAAMCGADYVAPYVNRMSDSEVDGCALVEDIIVAFKNQGFKTKVIAASFKNLNQVIRVIVAGADAVTVPIDIFEKLINNKSTNDAVEIFSNQRKSKFNKNTL